MGDLAATPHSCVRTTPDAGNAPIHFDASAMRTNTSATSPARQTFSRPSRPVFRLGFDELFPTGTRRGAPGRHDGREVPFAFPGVVEATPIGELFCAAGTIDDHGRVSDRSALKHLAWYAGQALGFEGDDQFVVVRWLRQGRWSVGRSGYLLIPAAFRHRCNLDPGDRVLLAASRDNDLLVVVPPAVMAAALWAYRPQTWQKPV
ncbi:AbrB/MazE/SpoVT family DNA-binding domain-containing protein [Nocardia nepalensis]|uniref:AbrB/MazE/SpoVT family DNA-binding domain-containing protein n=1 Tax=Nocardia nepalensis TaxID=3375448 RepID=UPI003B671299